MMGERRAVLILMLVLCSVLVSLPNIGIVKANEIIYIRADGTIEGTDKILREGHVYTFIGNIANRSMIVEKDNVVVDGTGYSLIGNDYNFEPVGRGYNVNGNMTGVFLARTNNVTIKNLEIKNYTYGIYLYLVNNSFIFNNTLSNGGHGIWIHASSPNKIVANTLKNNQYGLYSVWSDGEHTIYHNNFINNFWNEVDGDMAVDAHVGAFGPREIHVWDNGVEGNYYSDYEDKYPNATELESSGLWSTPYFIGWRNKDYYPLVAPITTFEGGTWEGTTFNVTFVSNSSVSSFRFYPENAQIIFNLNGDTGTVGFCRVTIPKDMLYTEGNWTILVDGYSVTPTVNEDTNSTYLYFTYQQSSNLTKTVEIIGTEAIPEFPSLIILPLFLTVTVLALVVRRRINGNSGL